MKLSILFLITFLILGFSRETFAQTNKAQAQDKLRDAIQLMDSQQFDSAITLLKEATVIDSKNSVYEYELGYAYFLKGDKKNAIATFQKLVKAPDATDQYFQMLGNFLSMDGNPAKASEAYDAGLKKFPSSGRLYLEKGNLLTNQQKYTEALVFYEKGIEVDPTFPSNYLRAAEIYLFSKEEVWGMLYGEIFMNLERNSKRTGEMSKLLFDTYKREINFTSDTSFTVSFSQNNVVALQGSKKEPKLKIPFGMGAYEPTLLLSLLHEKQINLASLSRTRERFVQNYFQNEWAQKYPNALFSFQKQVMEAGHLEAYNHWLLMLGDQKEFSQWQQANQAKWTAFLNWFPDNGLRLSQSNKFYRAQYN